MSHEVVLTEEAERGLEDAYEWYARQSTEAANLWYSGILMAITSLERNPERCPLATDNDRFPVEIRQLNYGSGRRLTHRIVFTIRPDRVIVYAIRHLAQQDLRPEDV